MTTVTIGDVALEGATVSEQSGGWNAPEQRVERGFSFSTYVNAEPIEVTVEAWVTDEELSQLEDLRQSSEPFSASVGAIGVPEAKLDDLVVDREGNRPNHYEVVITVIEVQFAELETAEVTFEAPGGSLSSSADSTSTSTAGSNPSDDDPAGSGGIVDSLRDTANSLQTSLFG